MANLLEDGEGWDDVQAAYREYTDGLKDSPDDSVEAEADSGGTGVELARAARASPACSGEADTLDRVCQHGMADYVVPAGFQVKCDVCQRTTAAGARLFGCRICDVDFCPRCFGSCVASPTAATEAVAGVRARTVEALAVPVDPAEASARSSHVPPSEAQPRRRDEHEMAQMLGRVPDTQGVPAANPVAVTPEQLEAARQAWRAAEDVCHEGEGQVAEENRQAEQGVAEAEQVVAEAERHRELVGQSGRRRVEEWQRRAADAERTFAELQVKQRCDEFGESWRALEGLVPDGGQTPDVTQLTTVVPDYDGTDPAPLAELQRAVRTWRRVGALRANAEQHPDAFDAFTAARPPRTDCPLLWQPADFFRRALSSGYLLHGIGRLAACCRFVGARRGVALWESQRAGVSLCEAATRKLCGRLDATELKRAAQMRLCVSAGRLLLRLASPLRRPFVFQGQPVRAAATPLLEFEPPQDNLRAVCVEGRTTHARMRARTPTHAPTHASTHARIP